MAETNELRDNVVGLYEVGCSLRTVCEIYKVSYWQARMWVLGSGVEMRVRGRMGKGVDRGLVEGLWREGESVRGISRRVGISRGRVRRLLCEWGLLCWGGEYVI